MSWPRRLTVGLFGLVLLGLAAFTIRSMVRYGEVLPGVSVAGIDLGGLGRADATTAVLALEDELSTSPVSVVIDGTSLPLDPGQVEFTLDTAGLVQEALDTGRRSGFGQLADWITGRRYENPPAGRLSEQALIRLIEAWEPESISMPPFNGDVRYQNGAIITEPPRAGFRVDRESAPDAVLDALLSRQSRTAVLDITPAESALDPSVVAEAAQTAAELVAAPIVLTADEPGVDVTFDRDELGRALVSQAEVEPVPALELTFDPTVIAAQLAPLVATLEAPPLDATFEVLENDRVAIVPGRPGAVVDPELIAGQLLLAASFPGRTAPLPFATGVEPAFTTTDAEALGISGKVAEFTTFHDCCQPRVTNIQRMADLVDGTIVFPGEEFSLNEHVGLRTLENGFVAAPMILRGEFVPAVGGGVSQFATTLYNAVFFGGYENVFHQPHSYYFSRYPEGREATVSFPNPELIFRNDTAAGLLITSEYTEDSITVKLFGDNEGRQVSDSLSPRRDFRDPVTEYQPDSSVAPGTEVVVDRGRVGWTVTVGRTITYPDGTEKEEEWDWTYRPQPRRVRVHPCDVPGTTVTCPTTTTVSPPTTTTTTTPPLPGSTSTSSTTP